MSSHRSGDDSASGIPHAAGIGLRAAHYDAALSSASPAAWFEVHAENYFAEGGPHIHYLERIRSRYPLSLHGVGLSLGSSDALDREHLVKLKGLVDRFAPGLVSEHLSWGAIGRRHLNDLLPLPYTEEALRQVCTHIDETQDFLGRQILIENISAYLSYRHSIMTEDEFIAELVAATGCGILLDVNNLYVNAVNHAIDPHAYLRRIPSGAVREFHLAGFEDAGDLLIDTHGTRIADPVWDLYRAAVERFGPLPTLIEWDTNLPAFPVLQDEAGRAQQLLEVYHAAC
ncbi:MNIO family bufferin maturase [Massilia horti]|uniref:UPF0276 protein E4O92_08445 n=1 Tax=Massilia horti TaxID=2562153 RepID=A0A4Y9T0N4_9BURK|nr:DUF692 domain-containing protein [Massilia horti]TFW32944.1 DUF692 domain-containing protein [Massilia horti]